MPSQIPACQPADERLEIRIHGPATLPTLIYLPGLHGDWTLVGSFRAAIAGRARLVEVVYPRTLTWTLQDYARHIAAALVRQGVSRGWLLGESFGSQIGWPMLAGTGGGLTIDGVILAGGFVRHPVQAAVRMAHYLSDRWPRWFLRAALMAYGKYAVIRHRQAPETLAAVGEFVTRRLDALDRLAIKHRLALIARSDPRPVAAQTHRPVFSLVGLVDPIVPALPVWMWLRRHCPGYRGARLLWGADHNVLGTAPRQCSEQVLRWMAETGGGTCP